MRDLQADDLDADQRHSVLRLSTVRVVQLGPALPAVLRIDGGGDACGATGNCPTVFYDSVSRRKLLSTGGFDVHLLPAAHHRAHDVVARWNLSCCEGTKDLYRFDGSVYHRVRESPETY